MRLYVRRTLTLCLRKVPVHGGSVPYRETVGLQVLLLGLAHGSTTTAVLSTEPTEAFLKRQWVWHEIIGCLCTCWGELRSGTAVTSLFWGKSQQVSVSHLQGHELDLTHRQRGGTATVGGSLQPCVSAVLLQALQTIVRCLYTLGEALRVEA